MSESWQVRLLQYAETDVALSDVPLRGDPVDFWMRQDEVLSQAVNGAQGEVVRETYWALRRMAESRGGR